MAFSVTFALVARHKEIIRATHQKDIKTERKKLAALELSANAQKVNAATQGMNQQRSDLECEMCLSLNPTFIPFPPLGA